MSIQSNEALASSRGHQMLQASLHKREPLTEAEKHKMASDMLKEHHHKVQASQCTPSSQAGSHQQLSQADLPKTTSCLPGKNVLDNRLKTPGPSTSPKQPVKRAHSARTAGRTETTDKFCTAPQSSRPELGAPLYEHDYLLRAPAADYPCVMDAIDNAAQLVYSTESAFVRHGFISQGSTSLLELEKQLLEVAAYEGVTQGVFYMMRTSSGGGSLIRYFESGSFLGFLHHLQATSKAPPGFEDPSYRVYSEEDVEEEQRVLLKRRDEISRKRTSGHPKEGNRNRSGEKYTRYLRQLKAHLQSVKETASSSEDHADVTHLYIQILRKNASANNKDHNYVHSIGMEPLEQELIEKALQEARLQGPYPYPFPSRTSLQSAETPLTMQQQLDALCTLSNHPKCTFPKSDGQLSASSARRGFLTYLSYQAPRDENQPDLQPRHLPSSHRNRFLFFNANCRSSDRALLLKFIFSSRAQPPLIEAAQPSLETVVPQKRVRPPFQRVDVTPQLLRRSADNTSSVRLNTFEHFRSKLVEVGTILWRLHTPAKEYFIMSDYGDDGEIIPNSFAEVLYSHQDGAVSCSCTTYRAILSVAKLEDTSDELVLPEGILCMHCRFLQEEIVQHIPELVEGKFVASSSLGQKLCDSVRTMNSPVVKLTPITSTQGTQKYSVRPRSDDSCAVINVTSGLMVFCTRGVCQAASKHKKKVKRLLELTEAAAVCEHLEAMRANQEAWVPSHQAVSDVDETDEDVEVDDVPPVPQEQSSQPPSQSRFNVETGQWDFGGYSTHKPRDESDVKLSRHVRARMAVHYDSTDFTWDSKAGTFTGLDFIPRLPTDDTCVCGSAYRSENHPEGLEPQQHFTCTLYMRHAPIRCNVFFRKCLDNCDNKVIYSGEDSSVFFWSKEVALGDEIGWDFVNKVLATKISFSAYCDEMTRTYRSNHPTSAAFISKTTFISWFFAWCGRMEIDFREHIDPWCGHDPASLAGDGTHVGLSQRRVNITPVDKADSDELLTPHHKRFDRVFLPYRQGVADELVRQARTHLRSTCKSYLSVGSLEGDDLGRQNENLLLVCPQDARCSNFIQSFVDGDFPADYKQAVAKFLLLLSCDAALTTVIPFQYHASVTAAATNMLLGNIPTESFDLFCPELGKAVQKACGTNRVILANFLLYLLDFINSVHASDPTIPDAIPLPNTYNPESGVAYYFTPSGNQVRQIPTYQVNTSNNNFDDNPCEGERCNKQYGKVSVGGWTYMFLWFCPLHGHCYGFHIINGAEGRKDPTFSLLRYKPKAPRELFYDFACSFNEYCLNRVPDFVRNTRFWHDVFHGVNHVCGDNFKSRRIANFTGVNTEICEQFNSFLQCMKYTGTHMSQAHFCFFVQFMIYIWNTRKTKAFQKKLHLALAGYG